MTRPPHYETDEYRAVSRKDRQPRESRPTWPLYVGAALSVAAVVWSAAVNVANAAATSDNVRDIKQQLYQMQVTSAQIRSAVDVLNCRVGITCRTDGH